MLLSYCSNIRNLVFDQSSPVQPISESRGGSTSVTEEDGRWTEIIVSNIGYKKKSLDNLVMTSNSLLFIALEMHINSHLPDTKDSTTYSGTP